MNIAKDARVVSDDIDRAQDADAVNTQDALERQRRLAKNMLRLVAIGECLNPHCAEPFAANDNTRLYCGPRCEAEHSRMKRVS
jgi:hypothetical protein